MISGADCIIAPFAFRIGHGSIRHTEQRLRPVHVPNIDSIGCRSKDVLLPVMGDGAEIRQALVFLVIHD